MTGKNGLTHPSTRTLRDEAAQRRLCQTLAHDAAAQTHSSIRRLRPHIPRHVFGT